MKQISGIFSLRTQFVRLYVRDFSEGNYQAGFLDYGLFTQVEIPGRRYLRSRMLDSTGQLYKATFFEFARYPEDIRLVTDPKFDKQAFSSKLEIKGSNDHSKLIRMLDELNNYDLPIEYVFERYFDEENYFTWLAYNILVGNVDTQSQNFYLYSPSYEDKWYFIPWDYDDTFLRRSRTVIGYSPYQNWEYGIANYWGSHLHNRVLRVEKYRNALNAKINELMMVLTPERIRDMVERYKAVTIDYMSRSPDINYTDYYTAEGIEFDYQTITENIQINYDLYLLSLETSMPYYLGTPEVVGGELRFTWDESYNFEGGEIEYYFALSNSWDFKTIIYEKMLVDEYSIAIPYLTTGDYCWRVLAVNQIGRTAYSFDEYEDEITGSHSGMKCFTLTSVGEVVER
jgi:spore coat protein H